MHGAPAPGNGETTPPGTRFSKRLNASDSLLWHIEADPCLRTPVVAIALLDRCPDWTRLRERFAAATLAVPRLREKVVDVPWWLGAPRWMQDGDFDLDYHLRRVAAPPPADVRGVLDLAAPIAMAAFDKDRPLWEFTLVEGLEGGRAALIQKVHHSFTDGVGGVELARAVIDGARNEPAPTVTALGPVAPDRRNIVVDALNDSLTGMVRAFTQSRGAAEKAAESLRHPRRAVDSAVRRGRSVGKLLAPASRPFSPVMAERGMSRRLAAFDVPFDELRAAGHAAGCTLNDAFLAAVTGGARRYHVLHGATPPALRATMPINVRQPGDAAGSNRFTPARFALPLTTLDPIERMRELGALAKRWRDEPAVGMTSVIAEGLNHLPPSASTSLFGSMLKGVDLVATNVPGLSQRSYLAGAEVVRYYAFAPPSGSAFSIALLSHVDQCCIGVNVDTAAVPDAELLGRCLLDGFEEVIAAGTATAGVA